MLWERGEKERCGFFWKRQIAPKAWHVFGCEQVASEWGRACRKPSGHTRVDAGWEALRGLAGGLGDPQTVEAAARGIVRISQLASPSQKRTTQRSQGSYLTNRYL